MFKNKMVLEALKFAVKAHGEQKRKYTGDPYIVHPIEVAEIVSGGDHTDAMLAAALLHDVVEDTDATLDDLKKIFNIGVVALVDELTDISKPEDGNRAVRKALDRAHIASASNAAQIIKCADLISNTSSIVQFDPIFARVYLAEKRALLDVMSIKGHPLHTRAMELTNE